MLVCCLNLYLSHSAAAKEQQCSEHLSCVHINRGLAEQTGKGPSASESKVACRFYGQIGAIWVLSHISEKSFPLTKPDFQDSAWKRTLFAVSQHVNCGMTDPREKHTSCSSWFRKTLYTSSPLAAGAGPKTLTVCLPHLLLCCIWQG